ncbi:MAG TPA: carbamoyl-phosphate synthase large subunit [Atribacter sp.]|uniref:carbamoyl-phosphate synthase large subunit n=1 Tax=Atribacter sp. TaxID=2847780 RepID=UPI0017695D7F|nr:carbamoyl-phosphate synthase large subunit [Atribacter sp.]MDI9593749.1 carbamoyl-phosphate synthase large subunit [Atribacterota bacterium]HHT09467.1 carbamoyl-phosphate synthase large subunit [Candidatus Atribacteria bacterium]HQK82334.1 carbamoyl-phosphate synthase large subunit [Atribacter sp.]
MPRNNDIHRICIVGSGPITIGQACEFDYSGTQGCKALKSEGYEIILINSNPATIMTDPEMADRTYIEPLIPEVIEKIIAREKPDAFLPILGGQTALNLTVQLENQGIFKKYGIKVLGASPEAISKAEDRELFKEAMLRVGIDVPQSDRAYSLDEAKEVANRIGFPLVIRPSFTLGGTGGSIAYNIEEFENLAQQALESSIIREILIEESVIGWKEIELEVMRDSKDNVVVICSIENFDPMGIHTGDSITIAPAQTLTDKEYQHLRDLSIRAIREIGVASGGCNIQFALNPTNGKTVIIEMNPRVSRSSALASKATGFPIAKIAAKLAVGYSLDEIPNDITRKTPACFEPAIDYCVVKIPRFTFEKFPDTEPVLGISMKSVGETMAIGRNFKEALQKGLRSLEIGKCGLEDLKNWNTLTIEKKHFLLREKLQKPNPDRLFFLKMALKEGVSLEEIYALSSIDPWFIRQIDEIIEMEKSLVDLSSWENIDPEHLRRAKEFGFSDRQLATLWKESEWVLRNFRLKNNIKAVYKQVDTCAAEFEAETPYYYSTYEEECEANPSSRNKVIILGAGPNRIGQGIEFDYCCVHATWGLRDLGYETIMVNSNPETVSTDYDTSDKLYFEPVFLEDVLNIIVKEKPIGVIVQLGGQTPLNLARDLEKAGVPILGTSPESIDIAEDRDRFKILVDRLGLIQPKNGVSVSFEGAREVAVQIGYPVVVRPSYVLGGRAMKIVYSESELFEFMNQAVEISPGHPVLIDKFLEDAIEVDVDAISDGETTIVAGIMEHIEEAGVHSGDSACVIPPFSLSDEIVDQIKLFTQALARELNVIGLMNVQYAVKEDTVYVLEVNPRASRTIPFVSKATGVPLARLASQVMVGRKLSEIGLNREVEIRHFAVKEAVFPFNRFPGVDPILGPEMRSTGEVMGIDADFGMAFAKSQIGTQSQLPQAGRVFISVKNQDKRGVIFVAKKLVDLGFQIVATKGTAKVLMNNGITVEIVNKVGEGRPNVVDFIKNQKIDLIINTPSGGRTQVESSFIRKEAVIKSINYVTTLSGAEATVYAIERLKKFPIQVRSIQEYHQEILRTLPV